MRLPVAGPVPYSKGTTGGGVAAPLAVVPSGTAISAENARGKIVVRDAKPGSVPQAAFLLPIISWGSYDPGNTIDPAKNFDGDFIAYNDRMADLRAAAAAGAKGLLFVKDLPTRQIAGHYEPYDGIGWDVPGLFLGADEGKRLTDAIAAGANPSARITIKARVDRVTTPTVIATLPGASPQRIVVDSHTDGTNAAEDNGPIAMLAMARYLARLDGACRPRTIQFTFSTAHFYQRLVDRDVRHGGAGQIAAQLDADYDKGTVSSVLVLEHLGAIEYDAVPRADGGPGNELKPSGQRAIQFVAITPSPPLVKAVDDVVRRYDMRRTLELQGSDVPGSTTPAHCSFGGEGTPYDQHLLPTIGVIAAPQSLYDPAFGIEGDRLRRDALRAARLHRARQPAGHDVAGRRRGRRARRARAAQARRADVQDRRVTGLTVRASRGALSALPRVHSVPPMLIRRVVPTLFALALLVPSTAFAIPNTNGGGTGPDPDAWPTARLSAPDHALQYSNVTLDASGSSDDDGRIVKYEWDFNGAAGWDRTTTSPRTTAYFGGYLNYAVRVRVTDDDGHTSIASAVIRVHPGPRASFFVAPGQPTAGKPATLVAKDSYAERGQPAVRLGPRRQRLL